MFCKARLFALILGGMAGAWGGAASGEDYPLRTSAIVVPFSPGGGPDLVARLLAEELTDTLGRAFIVDNRSGASGNIGAASVARAAPDGYSLLLGTPYPMLLNKLMTANLSFDPEAELTPIALIGKSPQILVTRPDAPWRNLKDMLTYARSKPGALSVGIPGIGTTSHLAIEALMNLVGGKMTIVPYRGTPPVGDVVNGQIDIAVSLVPSYVSMIKSGMLLTMATTTDRRSEQTPDAPTVEELGFPGFDVSAWYVLAAPAGTPRPIVDKLNAAVNGFLANDRWKERLRDLDVQPIGGGSEDAKAFIAEERARFEPIIKAADIRM